MAQHRVNRPITAQLEVLYSKGEEPGRSKIVGTLLRVKQPEDERDNFVELNGFGDAERTTGPGSAQDDAGHRASFQTHLSNNMKVCDLYQCEHSRHYHLHDDWYLHVPVSARRFSESNLTRLPDHYSAANADFAKHQRHGSELVRPVSESTLSSAVRPADRNAYLKHGAGHQPEYLPPLAESDSSSKFTPGYPFREHYTLHNLGHDQHPQNNTSTDSVDMIQDPTIAELESSSYEEASPTASRSVFHSQKDQSADSLHASHAVPSSNSGMSCDQESGNDSIDLSSPFTKHHHRRNSLAVRFKKPRFKSV